MILVIKRRVELTKTPPELDAEFRAARWVYHRLLDFELEHQAMMDAVSPKLTRVGRILARLKRRERWAERAREGCYVPPLRLDLRAKLDAMRTTLRAERNASPDWVKAKNWPKEIIEPKQCRRKAGESDAAFEARQAKAGRTRREVHALQVYKEKRCYWGTYNAQLRSVEQALKSVMKARAAGQSARLRRPRYDDPGRLTVQASSSGFKLLAYEKRRLRCQFRLKDGWFDLQTSCRRSLLPTLPADYEILVAELCREKDGHEWYYTLCLTVKGSFASKYPKGTGIVGIDTGHRLMPDGSIRAFTWYGSDGKRGEVRLPAKISALLQLIHRLQSNLDESFNKLKTGFQTRQHYRSHLQRLGVRTEEQTRWLSWEYQQDYRINATKERIQGLRQDLYHQAARDLRSRYAYMAIDTVGKDVQFKQKSDGIPGVIRQNRDLVAAYSFKVIASNKGLEDLVVSGVDSTRTCALCGQLHKNTSKLKMLCPTHNIEHDQDYSAAYIMLSRGVLAVQQLQTSAS